MPTDGGLVGTGDDLWRLTMEHSPVGMALLDTDGRYLMVNRALCVMLGYSAEAMTSMTYESLTHPDDLESGWQSVRQMLAGEMDSFRVVKRWIRADGSVLLADLSVALLRDGSGAPIHVIAQVVDLTERRTLEMQLDAAQLDLQSAQAQAEAVFEAAGVGLLLSDADGSALTMNERQREFMALVFPEGFGGLPGQTGHVYTADQSRVLTREELPSSRATAGERSHDVMVWIGKEPRTRRALSISTRPVRLPTGEIVGTAAASLDVTDLVHAKKAKDDFVAASSHELRTPLAAILANLELLEDADGLDGAAQSHVAAVRRNAWRLSRLVADLIYAARSSAGSPAVDPYDVDLVPLLHEAVSASEVDAAPRQVILGLLAPESLVSIKDGLRLRHAMDNLLAHAIVSCRRGGRVDVALAAEGDLVVVTVRHEDDGMDQSGARADHMFLEPKAFAAPFSGQGLGLGIVRTIVEGHGGEVSVETTTGVSSTVRVTLPR